MLYSACGHCCSSVASSKTSLRRMWRSSGRGCTVMPSAPASSASVAARSTLGMPKWRVLRNKATLLTLTDKAVPLCRGCGVASGATSGFMGRWVGWATR